ncbi:translation initiation factor IF-2-like [Passer montanus]|uniref:translation initiation factor IF-2-like n=1 Tax=Passer montanus TaxID=9160 RepID=UPI00195FD7BF|nr:translation initiation factor IF-2-like [Passer montanus]
MIPPEQREPGPAVPRERPSSFSFPGHRSPGMASGDPAAPPARAAGERSPGGSQDCPARPQMAPNPSPPGSGFQLEMENREENERKENSVRYLNISSLHRQPRSQLEEQQR